jgi:hypothetical protein
VRCLGLILSLGLAGQPVSAQVDEADRLQRCENNRAGIASMEAQQLQTYNDEEISRALLAIQALRRVAEEWDADVMHATAAGESSPQELQSRAQRWFVPRYNEIGRTASVLCGVEDGDCGRRMIALIQGRIAQSVPALPARRAWDARLAAYRNNMVALRCDQAANATFTLAGTWTGSNGLVYDVSQAGNNIGWRVNSIAETGAGSIQGRSVTASWNGNWGPGSSTGTVSIGPGGVANRIDWHNGVVFSR